MATPLNVGRRFSRKKHEGVIVAEKDRNRKSNAIQSFFRETTGELRKVSWPTWPEARQLTLLVLAVMVAMGILLGITDAGARALLNLILGFS